MSDITPIETIGCAFCPSAPELTGRLISGIPVGWRRIEYACEHGLDRVLVCPECWHRYWHRD